MKLIHRYSKKDSFAGSVLTLMMGTVGAQAIVMLSMPIIARFYRPEDLGILASFTAISSMVVVWSAWRYELAIVLPEMQEDAVVLARLSLIILAAMVALCAIVVLAGGSSLLSLLGVSYISPWGIFLPLSIFFAGFSNVMFYWCNRNKQFKEISISKVVQSGTMVLAQLAAIPLFSANAGGLILGYIGGQFFGAFIFLRELKNVCGDRLNLRTIKATAGRYSDFPKLSTMGAFLDTAAAQIPLIAITTLYSPHAGGLFVIADKVLRVPAALLGAAVSQVFYQRFVEIKADRDRRIKLILKTWLYLFSLGCLPMLVIFFFGTDIFSILLGSTWKECGKYASVLSIGFMFHFVAYPTSLGLVAMERLDILFLWQVLYFVSMVAVFVIGHIYLKKDIMMFLWVWSIKEGVLYLLYMLALMKANQHAA